MASLPPRLSGARDWAPSVLLSPAIYKWRHSQAEDKNSPPEDEDDDKKIEFNQRTPYWTWTGTQRSKIIPPRAVGAK